MKKFSLFTIIATFIIGLLMSQISVLASKDTSRSYIELYVDPNTVQYGDSVNITVRLYPQISTSVVILIESISLSFDEIFENITNGYFQRTWIPSMRGIYKISVLWHGNENYFAAMNQVSVEVIGGPGPSWIRKGAYLHYIHDLKGEIIGVSTPRELGLIYSLHPVEPRSSSTMWPEPIAYWPSSPSDMILIRAQEEFPNLSWNGPWRIINMTNRDAYGSIGGTWAQDNGKTWLWIDPSILIGDKVKLWKDSYTVLRSEDFRYKDEFREAWVLENQYRTLWYDKEIGILLKATNILNEAPVGEKVDYPYSVYLYDTNIPFGSSISLDLNTSETCVGSAVELSGHLNPSLDTSIQVEWSLNQATWNIISISASEGLYSYSWPPPCSGEIYLKTSWEGNEHYSGSESEIRKIAVFNDVHEMQIYYELQEEYFALKGKYDSLESNHTDLSDEYHILQDEYDYLEFSHEEISDEYQLLQDEYDYLESDHTELSDDYQVLQEGYEELVLDHELLSEELDTSMKELSLKTKILYVVSFTTILFIATTVYFARGRTHARSEKH